MTASAGHAVPCRPGVPVCAAPPGGLPPSYMVENVIMVGMTGSASFTFDADNRLVQTVVLFPTSDIGLVGACCRAFMARRWAKRGTCGAMNVAARP